MAMEANLADLTWREHSPGVWKRSVDEQELGYFKITTFFTGQGRMPLYNAIQGQITLKMNVLDTEPVEIAEQRLDSALRQAWRAIRFDHPDIVATTELDPESGYVTKIYRAAQNEAEVVAWLDRTLISIPTGETAETWSNGTGAPGTVEPTLFVLRPTGTSLRRDLVYRCPHYVIDGIGTLQLLDNIAAHVARFLEGSEDLHVAVPDGTEARNLTPPYRVAAGLSTGLTPEETEQLGPRLAAYGPLPPTEGVVYPNPPFHPDADATSPPGKSRNVAAIVASGATLEKVLTACKSHGATPTHAVNAAMAMALRDVQPQKSGSLLRYRLMYMEDQRPRLSPPYNTAQHAVSTTGIVSPPFMIDMPLPGPAANDVPAQKKEFKDIMMHVRDTYQRDRSDPRRFEFGAAAWGILASTYPPLKGYDGSPLPGAGGVGAISPCFLYGNGLVDRIVKPTRGALKIENPWSGSDKGEPGYQVYLETYDGNMLVRAMYNEAYHSSKDVVNYLEKTRNYLLQGLDAEEA